MKILHVTAMSPLSPNSGVPVVLKNLTEEQNKLENIEARVLSLCASVDLLDSIYFDYLGKDKLSNYLANYTPDIAIIHSFYHIEFASVAKELLRNKIPFLIEPHGSFGHNALKKGWLKKFIADHTVFRNLIKKSSGYIFTNYGEKCDSVYRAKRNIVIPNGICKDIVLNAAEKKEDSYSSPVFYFLGRYDIHHKGLDFLLSALKILDDRGEYITVRLYGIGNSQQQKFIHDKLKEFKSIDVRDMGTIYGADKKKALEEANILLLTSRYEGSPMTILDGFCYGNPCLVTPGTNVSDEVVNNGIGWSAELDAVDIANNILRAKADYINNGKDYVIRCKKHVVNNYVWSKIAIDSIIEYNKIINEEK